MKQYFLFIILFCLLFATSCKKDELPDSQIGTAEFVSQINFNGEQYQLIAGENGLVQSSNYIISDTAITLEGMIKGADCNECGPAYSLTIQSPSDFQYIDGLDMVSALNTWNYSLSNNLIDYNLIIKGMVFSTFQDGEWSLNGESVQPIGDTLILEITEPGSYLLDYVVDQDPCIVSTSRIFDFNGENLPCYGNMVQDVISPTTFYAYPAFPIIPEEMLYIWTYGDSTIATGSTDNYTFPSTALYGEICVEMINGEGCSTTACYTPDISDDGTMLCTAEVFLFGAELVETIPTNFPASLILEFTDNSGVTFSSSLGSQNSASVEVISVSSYVEPTMPEKKFAKMELEISCTLYDNTGIGYPFSGTLQTAFEYP